jgi:hypothetical protein
LSQVGKFHLMKDVCFTSDCKDVRKDSKPVMNRMKVERFKCRDYDEGRWQKKV